MEKMAYSIREVSVSLGVSKGHVHNEIKRGNLKSVKLGRRRVIMAKDLDAYLGVQSKETSHVGV